VSQSVKSPSPLPLDVPIRRKWLRVPGMWRSSTAALRLARAEGLLTRIMLTNPRCTGPDAERWRTISRKWTSTGTAVFVVRLERTRSCIVVRINSQGAVWLSRETLVLRQLRTYPLPQRLQVLLPTRLAAGNIAGHGFTVDETLPGSQHFGPNFARDMAAISLIGELHQATAQEMAVDHETLQAWLGAPMRTITALLRQVPLPLPRDALNRLVVKVQGDLLGKSVKVSWIHGDFWAGNLLVDGSSRSITGIIDWDLAAFPELPLHDVLQMLLLSRTLARHESLGQVVAQLLNGGSWTTDERKLLDAAAWAAADDIDQSTLLLLYWLRYMAAIGQQQEHYVDHSVLVWRLRNLHPVLRAL
jgi:aminoglycoside phosphotransferase (APT) family kinase protein